MNTSFIEAVKRAHIAGTILGDIDESEAVLKEHARDISVFEMKPQCVLFPKYTQDIVEVMKIAQEYAHLPLAERPSITVRAGGTCMSGGSLTESLVLNLTRYMNHFTMDARSRTLTTDMGVMFKEIEATAAQENLFFGAYISSKDICGIGGMIGNNASGEKSVRLGATIDNVLGLEVVLHDGTVIKTGVLEDEASALKTLTIKKQLIDIRTRIGTKLTDAIGEVPKAASGYRLERIDTDITRTDLTPLFVGAQGTLGVITRAVLKLSPTPAHAKLLVLSIHSLEELPFVLTTVMKARPVAVETFDINTFNKEKLYLKEYTDHCEQFFSEGVSLIVLAEFAEETHEATIAAATTVKDALAGKSITIHDIADSTLYESVWKLRRSSFLAMAQHNDEGWRAVPCIEDIIVPIHAFDKLVPGLLALIEKYKLWYGFHGHIGSGSLRIVPVFDFRKDRHEVVSNIINFTREAIALIKSLHGNMSADHSDGIIRTPFLQEFYGDAVYQSFVAVKDVFDPNRIINRNKKVDGTFEMIEKYIQH